MNIAPVRPVSTNSTLAKAFWALAREQVLTSDVYMDSFGQPYFFHRANVPVPEGWEPRTRTVELKLFTLPEVVDTGEAKYFQTDEADFAAAIPVVVEMIELLGLKKGKHRMLKPKAKHHINTCSVRHVVNEKDQLLMSLVIYEVK